MNTRLSIRLVRLGLVLGAVLAVALLAPSAVTAEEAGDADFPRTAAGRPDFSGTYDVATLTPLTRPRKYGDKLTITKEEAEAIEKYWAENLAKDSEKSDPDREAPPEGGVEIYVPEFSGAAGKVGGYNAFYVDLGDETFEIDGKYRTSILVDPPSGQFPPLTDAAKQRMAKQAANFHENTGTAWWIDRPEGPYDHPESRPLAERCLLGFGSVSGPPMLPVMYNNMKRIVQTEDTVLIVVEMNHDVRVVRMNGEHADPSVRKWLGDSIGWWEGDTLVVETTNFRDQPGFTRGSRDMKVTERFSRLDADTLLYNFTVEDPSTWTEPWTGEYPWPASDNEVYEYACHEGNYALGNIMRGARLLEAEALSDDGSSD